ncbi:MAG: proline--tRNA ligase [Candidatus Hydrothermarchaeaceae archaeon]
MRENWKNHFSEWYNDIIERAQILDTRYPVKGHYVWFPYGFKLRKHVLNVIGGILDEMGHEEALFPLLVPEHEFAKEAKHIHGFEDQVYWVTHGGLDKLNVKLALRPTSETAIYPMFVVWIRSHADMPLKIYQIVNVFRHETKHTRPLIRLREITTFIEAHTAHATAKDADTQAKEAIEAYKKFFDTLGVPYTITRRPDWDKFPGAEYTIAFDTIFPDGKVLQIGTVHNLGQNFAKTFDITFEDLNGEQEHVHQTCYGISDRCISALITTHGDDKGLCIMPEVAPIQCVIIPIWYKEKQDKINQEVRKLESELDGIRVRVDKRDVRPGSKYFDWEIKGVPLRIELGPKDIKEKKVTVVRRDTGKKDSILRKDVKAGVLKVLDEISRDLKSRAQTEFNKKIHESTSLKEAAKIVKGGKGIVRAGWCGDRACADKIEGTDVAILGILEDGASGSCIGCKQPVKAIIQMGKSY